MPKTIAIETREVEINPDSGALELTLEDGEQLLGVDNSIFGLALESFGPFAMHPMWRGQRGFGRECIRVYVASETKPEDHLSNEDFQKFSEALCVALNQRIEAARAEGTLNQLDLAIVRPLTLITQNLENAKDREHFEKGWLENGAMRQKTRYGRLAYELRRQTASVIEGLKKRKRIEEDLDKQYPTSIVMPEAVS